MICYGSQRINGLISGRQWWAQPSGFDDDGLVQYSGLNVFSLLRNCMIRDGCLLRRFFYRELTLALHESSARSLSSITNDEPDISRVLYTGVEVVLRPNSDTPPTCTVNIGSLSIKSESVASTTGGEPWINRDTDPSLAHIQNVCGG